MRFISSLSDPLGMLMHYFLKSIKNIPF